jgi:tetratricopeptide (TPR) repeat protein
MEFDEDPVVAPLADMIRREIGVERDARPEGIRTRLDELVKGCCDPTEFERTAARIGLMLGLGEDVSRGEGHSFRLAEIRAGLLALIEGMAQTGPVVMVIDDLHLADPQLLDLVEALVASARRLPLMVVALARDWLLEERPEWGSSLPDALRLRLEPLGVEDATELVRRAGESLDEPTAEQIARRAGGNPFFIVEMTGMLLQNHNEHAEGIAHSHLLPPTVQAVVASRIDHLPESARDLVRKASVFPRKTFHESELALIAVPEPEILQKLEDEEVFVPDEERPHVWRFRHGMLRDVAYESLPKRERLRLHLEVAEGLAREGEDHNLRSIAYHLEQAAGASLDLDPTDRGLADRAVEALLRAGNRDRRAMESATAVDEYERALALSGDDDQWGTPQARILAGIGEARYWLGEFEDAAAALERALELGAGDDWTEAHAGRFLADVTLNIASDQQRAEALFERALDAARRLGDDWVMARTLLMAGWAPFWREDLDGARAMFEQALEIAQGNPEGDRWAEARALTSLASVISPIGDEEECLALGQRALELGKEMGDRFTMAVAQSYVGGSLRRMWRLDEALPFEHDAVRTFRDLAARWELASTIGDRGSVFRLMGDLDRAEEDLLEALKICVDLGDRSLIGWTAAELARVRLAQGDESGAREALEQPRAGTMEDQTSMRSAEALILRAAGEADRARAIAAELLDEARTEGHRNYLAGLTWWVGRLFGEDVAGGADAVEEAGRTLEGAHWVQSLREPDLWTEPVPAG